jgi:hypothetical protein
MQGTHSSNAKFSAFAASASGQAAVTADSWVG